MFQELFWEDFDFEESSKGEAKSRRLFPGKPYSHLAADTSKKSIKSSAGITPVALARDGSWSIWPPSRMGK
ncbi:hypothetical protein H5410_043152 [Solanum commersonii]|uniref:Uncharacterized protein n=1 Tax=Solanum commersonii TaxID=4109 RepID=A0A9J5Y0L5_SOLCO|nr:hypothetical protein H5410_043152 [Solanum commersonii]